MKTIRKLTIDPEFLVDLWSHRGPWIVGKNRLPEDARLVGIEIPLETAQRTMRTLVLSIESAAFLPTDPPDLPAIEMTEYKS